MKKNKSMKMNFIFNFIKTLMSTIFPLITFPYASRVLLPEGLGQANYVTSIVSYFSMLAALGIGTYAIREGSKIRDDKDKLNSFANEIFTLNIFSTIISYIIFFIVLNFHVFDSYKHLLILSSLSIMFTTLGVEWIYSIYEDYKYITIRSFIFQGISLILLFVLVKNENDVFKYVALTVISSVGSCVFNIIHSRKWLNLKIVKLEKEKILKYLKPIMIIFSITISTTIYSSSDVLIIGLFKGDQAVGFYSTAVKLILILVALICSISTVLLPRLSYYTANDEFKKFEDLIKKSIDLMLIFIIPMIVGVFLLSKEIIYIIAGENYSDSVNALKIFSLYLFLSPINNLFAYQILMPLRKEKISLISTSVGAVINIILNIILVPIISFYGAAITTIIAEIIVFFICAVNIKRDINVLRLFNNIYQYIISAIPIFFICIILKNIFYCNIYVYLTLSVSISSIIYFTILILFKNKIIMELIDTLKRKALKVT